MGVFEHFPYTNFHELNLDFLLEQVKSLHTDVEEWKAISSIKFADPIEWTDSKRYEPWHIVLAPDGNSYISLKFVPVGVDVTNTEYWQRVANSNAQLESAITKAENALTASETALENSSEAINAVNELDNSLGFYNYTDGKRLYVDGVNGDDSNDGSAEHPIKTLDHFFDILNNLKGGSSDIRCYIVTAGVYEVSHHSINHATVHITGNVPNVIIKFTSTRGIRFYQCHCNFVNFKFQAPDAEDFALDGVGLSATDIVFDVPLTYFYDVMGTTNRCTFNRLWIQHCVLTQGENTFTNSNPNENCVTVRESLLRWTGTLHVGELDATSSSNVFLTIYGSWATIVGTYPNLAHKYYDGIDIRLSTLLISQARWTALTTRGARGSKRPVTTEGYLVVNTDTEQLLGLH